MNINERAQAFIELGHFLDSYVRGVTTEPPDLPESSTEDRILTGAIRAAMASNPWFILPHILESLQAIAGSLKDPEVGFFTQTYSPRIKDTELPATIAVIMAGNVPLVGFHDFFCVVLSGNRFLGKLSSEDKHLLPALSQIMAGWHRGIQDQVTFTDGMLSRFNAVIATGSDNTSRYFEFYFGKYPHIIRRHRNSVAVLNGTETPTELEALGRDVFSYFGRGCRNVSRLFLPANYPIQDLSSAWIPFSYVMDHHKYRNNYDYHKSIFIVSYLPYLDLGMILIKKDPSFHSPLAVIHFTEYDTVEEVNELLGNKRDKIQCIVSKDPAIDQRIPFGSAQRPSLFDFADGIDTMEFLIQNRIK
ncbi:MAG: acyl-CoA reductase [Bacteroidales bacterium]|nr:hypothetical protein [Lentimicrobiaceae bacterium]MDD5694730.1 acyl-CoA reductase [Bacteroidales bacterium]